MLNPSIIKKKLVKKRLPLILNEAVNFEKEVIFIAVPKTGTTTVRNQLRQNGEAIIPNPHLSIIQIRDTLYTYFLKKSLRQNIQYPTTGISTDAELRTMSQEVFSNFFKFSSVRNPWARAVSLYYRREGVPTSENISFDTFCEGHLYASDTCRQPTLHRNQLDWLIDESGHIILDYVYKVENFSKAIKEINELTEGRIQLQYMTANTNPNSKSKSYQDMYTNHTRQLIAKRFEKDIDSFKYTFS